MPRRRREPRPIPAAAQAHEVAAIKAADLLDKLDDLIEDYRDWGKIPLNFRGENGFLGILLGENAGIDIQLPPDEPEPTEAAG